MVKKDGLILEKNKNNIKVMVNKKVALITGITGQDGSYLAELLLSKIFKGRFSKDSFRILLKINL